MEKAWFGPPRAPRPGGGGGGGAREPGRDLRAPHLRAKPQPPAAGPGTTLSHTQRDLPPSAPALHGQLPRGESLEVPSSLPSRLGPRMSSGTTRGTWALATAGIRTTTTTTTAAAATESVGHSQSRAWPAPMSPSPSTPHPLRAPWTGLSRVVGGPRRLGLFPLTSSFGSHGRSPTPVWIVSHA